VSGDRQGLQGGADGLLAVERELLGEDLHAHRRRLGEVVDEPGYVPLARRQEADVVGGALKLVRRGVFSVSGLGHRVRG